MFLHEVKSQLGIPTFNLNKSVDKDNKPTEWLSHWDNDNRRSISMHQDLVSTLKKDPNSVSTLAMKEPVVKTGEKGDYTHIVVFAYEDADEVL